MRNGSGRMLYTTILAMRTRGGRRTLVRYRNCLRHNFLLLTSKATEKLRSWSLAKQMQEHKNVWQSKMESTNDNIKLRENIANANCCVVYGLIWNIEHDPSDAYYYAKVYVS